MTTYTNVFGGGTIAPSDVSYRKVTLLPPPNPNVFVWPTETEIDANYLARIMDVTATVTGSIMTLPDARSASAGETVFLNNNSAQNIAITINNASNGLVAILAANTGNLSNNVIQLYLTDNTTVAGTWQVVNFGATGNASVANSLSSVPLPVFPGSNKLNPAIPINTINANTTVGINDWGSAYIWNGGIGTFTLALASTLQNGWYVYIRNQGTGALTITAQNTINGASSLILNPGDSLALASDRVSFYSFGLGRSANFAFNSIVVPLDNSSTAITLGGNQLNQISYIFTGTLDFPKNIVLPATTQQYWVVNKATTTSPTTNAGTLTFTTNSGSSTFSVVKGANVILFVDGGGNVVQADTGGISIPLAISQGGTGAVNTTDAITNLGGGSTGRAVFVSQTQAAAQTAIGSPSVAYVNNAVNNLIGIAVALG